MAVPPYFICAKSGTTICVSDTVGVRNHCSSQNQACSNVSICSQMSYFQGINRAPQSSGSVPICASEFRAASLLTACIRANPATYSTYSDQTDGSINICTQANTVNTNDSGGRCYGYSLDGCTFTLTTDQCKTYSSLGIGEFGVHVRDANACSGVQVATLVTVGNGGDSCLKSCVQKCF